MEHEFSRLEILIGKEKLDLLRNKRVAVFGIGGVGGAVCEALARSGIGEFDLIINKPIYYIYKTLVPIRYKIQKLRYNNRK